MLLSLAVGLALCSGCRGDIPDGKPEGKPEDLIAYLRQPQNTGESTLFVARPDGSSERRLSGRQDIARSVEWRADGSRLSYLGWEQLFDLKPDGSDRRALLQVDKYHYAQGWSPDGRYLALGIGRVNQHTWAPGVALLPEDGGELESPGRILGPIAWSPDSRQLAYTDTGSFYDAFPQGDAAAGLYAIDIETGRRTRLTKSGSARDIDPQWFPDGRRIAFIREVRYLDLDLYLLEIDEGVLARYASGVQEFAVSPDGSRLAWTPATGSGLFLGSLDASSRRRLTSKYVQSLTWSPDGTQIAYSAWDSARSEQDIYTVSIEDQRERRVTMTAADETVVKWRPN